MKTAYLRRGLRPLSILIVLAIALLAANMAYSAAPAFSQNFDASTSWPPGWSSTGSEWT